MAPDLSIKAANVGNPCKFRYWISNPFFPEKKMEASFYQSFPKLIHWKLVVQPTNRSLHFQEVTVILEGTQSNADYAIVADKLVLTILWNRVEVDKEEIYNLYNIHDRYHFVHRFWKRFLAEASYLEFRLEIYLKDFSVPSWNVRGPAGRNFLKDSLSKDLEECFKKRCHPNLLVYSTNRATSYRAHSFILRERWNNFFEENLGGTENDYRVVFSRISDFLLGNILFYMYSGKWTASGVHRLEYLAELFQVISKFQLYHLYECLTCSNSWQEQSDSKYVSKVANEFPLVNDFGEKVINSSFIWNIEPNSDLKLIYEFQYDFDNLPYYSYKLKSRCPSAIEVEVAISFDRVRIIRTTKLVHKERYKLRPGESVESGKLLLDNCYPDFERFTSSKVHIENGVVVPHFLVNNVSIYEGTFIQLFFMIGDFEETENKCLLILKDHMHEVLNGDDGKDLTVLSRLDSTAFNLHRAIVESRLSNWQEVFTADENNPDLRCCALSRGALQFFVDYIYTSKVDPILDSLVDEVFNFAMKCKFPSNNYFQYSMFVRKSFPPIDQ